MTKQVIIYTTPTCGYCRATKEFFKEHNVSYTEYDVSTDSAKAHEMIEESGQMGVPVIIIGGELVIGFDRPKLENLLGVS